MKKFARNFCLKINVCEKLCKSDLCRLERKEIGKYLDMPQKYFMNWKIIAPLSKINISVKHKKQNVIERIAERATAVVGVKKLLPDSVVFCFMYVTTSGLL